LLPPSNSTFEPRYTPPPLPRPPPFSYPLRFPILHVKDRGSLIFLFTLPNRGFFLGCGKHPGLHFSTPRGKGVFSLLKPRRLWKEVRTFSRVVKFFFLAPRRPCFPRLYVLFSPTFSKAKSRPDLPLPFPPVFPDFFFLPSLGPVRFSLPHAKVFSPSRSFLPPLIPVFKRKSFSPLQGDDFFSFFGVFLLLWCLFKRRYSPFCHFILFTFFFFPDPFSSFFLGGRE